MAKHRKRSNFRDVNLAKMTKSQIRQAMEEAYGSGEHLLDHCRGEDEPGLLVRVFERLGIVQSAREKLEGPCHALKCPKHDFSEQGAADRGWLPSVAQRLDNGQLQLRPSFQVRARTGRVAVGGGRCSVRGGRPGERLPSATVMGIACLLVQAAKHDRHDPLVRVSPFHFFHDLRDAARTVHLKGMQVTEWGLADSLLLQSSESGTWTANNYKVLEEAGKFKVFFITEVEASMLEATAGGSVVLDDAFGVPVRLPREVLDEACRRFPAGHVSLKDERKTLLFGVATVYDGGSRARPRFEARVDEACLLGLTENWVPNFSTEEHAGYSRFEALGYAYEVFPVYDARRHGGARPDALLTKWGIVAEIFGFGSEEYRAAIPDRIAHLEKLYPGRVWWWDALNESLDAALERLFALIAKIEAGRK